MIRMIQDRTFDLRDRGGILFNEKDHSYINAKGEYYTSSTSLIKQYKSSQFYDTQTARYKAIKDILPLDRFNLLKKNAGSWDNIVPMYWDVLIKKSEYSELLSQKADYYIDLWKSQSEAGTLEHSKREEAIKRNGGIEYKGVWYEYTDRCVLDIRPDEIVCSTEMLVWNHEMKLGGLVDLPLFNKGEVFILDYKTNKKIDKVSFGGVKMKYPFNTVMDCNYYHYSLQLTIYNDMICELTGFKKGENSIISTANKEYGRLTDEYIDCLDMSDLYQKIKPNTL